MPRIILLPLSSLFNEATAPDAKCGCGICSMQADTPAEADAASADPALGSLTGLSVDKIEAMIHEMINGASKDADAPAKPLVIPAYDDTNEHYLGVIQVGSAMVHYATMLAADEVIETNDFISTVYTETDALVSHLHGWSFAARNLFSTSDREGDVLNTSFTGADWLDFCMSLLRGVYTEHHTNRRRQHREAAQNG